MEADYDSDDETSKPSYSDSRHPRVQNAATKLLRTALVNAERDALSVADLWDTFSRFAQRYQYGQFVDTLVSDLKTELRDAISAEYHDELWREARDELKKDIRKESEDEIFDAVYEELRKQYEAEISAKLRAQVAAELRESLKQTMMTELRPEVQAALKVELMGNPAFVDEAKREVQRKALGL